jgi:hypothetical protein
MLMHELPEMGAAAARAQAMETEVAVELRSLNQKIRKLEEAQINNYVWAFVGVMVIAVVVMLKLY